MRALARVLGGTVALVLLAGSAHASDAPGVPIHGVSSGVLPPVVASFFTDLGIISNDACPGELQKQGLTDKRRYSRALGWFYRYTRNLDTERTTLSPFSAYLRSPLLSGFYERRGCQSDATKVEESDCAELIAKVGAQEKTMTVTLPQLDARDGRSLRETITDRLDRGEPVVLSSVDGEEHELDPAITRDVVVRACHR
jgi:hypothetical protein